MVDRYFGSDAEYADFQAFLASRPEAGRVITGAAPLRKVRWADETRGKGKRGGIKVIYLHFADLQILFMLDVYGKDEADDLSNEDKKVLKRLAAELGRELRKPKTSTTKKRK